MTAADSLVHARWVVPVEPPGQVLEHHCIVIRGGRIAAILPSAQARTLYTAAESLELPTHALIPGLVNAHTHAPMSLFRGLADDLPLMDWLNHHVWPAEQKWVGAEFVRDGTELAIAEMLKGGTTCFNDMYFFPEETARVAQDVGMRACVGLIVVDFPSNYAQAPQEYLHKGLRLRDALRHSELIATAFAPHAPYTVSEEAFARIRTVNNELNLPVHIHVHETAHEIEGSLAKTGMRPLKRLERLDLLNPNLIAVHMTQLTQEEIDTLATAGASVVHCPESNLKLASGFCPVQELLAAGVNVALGTDGAASNNDLDMIAEMRTAALLAKGVSRDATAVPARVALRMATLNGARALGLDDRTGSLTVGKYADLVAVDLSPVATQPVYDPVSHIVYAATREQVTDVWVAGRQLLKARRLTTLDEQVILQRAARWRDKIFAADHAAN